MKLFKNFKTRKQLKAEITSLKEELDEMKSEQNKSTNCQEYKQFKDIELMIDGKTVKLKRLIKLCLECGKQEITFIDEDITKRTVETVGHKNRLTDKLLYR